MLGEFPDVALEQNIILSRGITAAIAWLALHPGAPQKHLTTPSAYCEGKTQGANRIVIFRFGPSQNIVMDNEVIKGETTPVVRPEALSTPLLTLSKLQMLFNPLRHIVYMTNANSVIAHVGARAQFILDIIPLLYIKAEAPAETRCVELTPVHS